MKEVSILNGPINSIEKRINSKRSMNHRKSSFNASLNLIHAFLITFFFFCVNESLIGKYLDFSVWTVWTRPFSLVLFVAWNMYVRVGCCE